MITASLFPWEHTRADPRRDKRFFLDYAFSELRNFLLARGFKEANARQLFTALHRVRIPSREALDTPRLPKALLAYLADLELPSFRVFQNVRTYPSRDGSIKYLFTLTDGGNIEAVFMPKGKRMTLCISSQVGCALGCTFCATGALGLRRHLSPGEIVGQVYAMLADRKMSRERQRANVVFMGMGEPLHNFENVMKAFDLLTHPHGMVLSPKDVAVSTAGLVPKIRLLARRENRPQLMVSIAATTDAARSAVMPVNRAYPLASLMSCLENYPLRKRERIMLSYVLIAGVNDHDEDADRLAAMSKRFPSLVNLIPMNPHAGSPDFNEPDEAHLLSFYRRLAGRGVFTTIRRSRGRDVAAACGQLAGTARV